MVVGQDVAVAVHDEAGSLAPARGLPVAVAARPVVLDHGDVDDGRVHVVDDVGEGPADVDDLLASGGLRGDVAAAPGEKAQERGQDGNQPHGQAMDGP